MTPQDVNGVKERVYPEAGDYVRGGDSYSFGRVFFDPADIEYPDHKRDHSGSRGVLSELS